MFTDAFHLPSWNCFVCWTTAGLSIQFIYRTWRDCINTAVLFSACFQHCRQKEKQQILLQFNLTLFETSIFEHLLFRSICVVTICLFLLLLKCPKWHEGCIQNLLDLTSIHAGNRLSPSCYILKNISCYTPVIWPCLGL